jgi:signal transduction histidine kinase
MTGLQSKIVRVGDGDLNVTPQAFPIATTKSSPSVVNFNRMIQPLYKNREDVERLHRAQMSRAESLATLGEIAAGLAHEIRNPLAAIAGCGSKDRNRCPRDLAMTPAGACGGRGPSSGDRAD